MTSERFDGGGYDNGTLITIETRGITVSSQRHETLRDMPKIHRVWTGTYFTDVKSNVKPNRTVMLMSTT